MGTGGFVICRHVRSVLRGPSVKHKSAAGCILTLQLCGITESGVPISESVGVNGRLPPNLAESEFGAPSQCQGAPSSAGSQIAICFRTGNYIRP